MQLNALSLEVITVAFDRFNTQPTENIIRLMRMLSDDDNSFNKIIHNLNHYEYLNKVLLHIFYKPHPKRLKLGLCILKEGTVNFDFEHSLFELSEILYEFMKGKYNVQAIQNLIQRPIDSPLKRRVVPKMFTT